MSQKQADASNIPPAAQDQHPLGDRRLNLEFDLLVDADDPGFASEFESDFDNLSLNDSDSFTSDNEIGHSTNPTSSNNDSGNNGEDSDESDTDMQVLTNRFRTLTNDLQKQFLSQPKSTQLILGHEVSELFKSYSQHGSAARLSALVMEFLDGGDTVMRSLKRKITEEEYDPQGNKTGRMRTVEKTVLERARLKFSPLPEVRGRVAGKEIAMKKSGFGGKRKASQSNPAMFDRASGPKGGFGSWSRQRSGSRDIANGEEDPAYRIRPKTAGKIFPSENHTGTMDIDNAGRLKLPQYPFNFGNTPYHPDLQSYQDQQILEYQRQSQNIVPTPPSPPQPRNATTSTTTIPAHMYSLTNDIETQSLLLGPNPVIPFTPLADLKIPLPPNQPPTTYPPRIIPILNRIVALHAAEAQCFYTSLIDKYTLQPTPSCPDPPQPPAALFRLAIQSRLHSNLSGMLTQMLEHPQALPTETRTLFKDMCERHGVGKLNSLEENLLAKVGAVDEESVEAWWEGRMKDMRGWMALCWWIEMVEQECVERAKREGWF